MEEKKITQQFGKDDAIEDTEIDVGKINKAYIPYMEDETRNQIFFGGSSSGKSYSIAQRTIKDIWKGQRNYLICRQVATTIKKSVFNEITKAILNSNKSKYFTINRSEMTITCIKNNKQILFCGLDDSEKIKSITPIDGVITDVIVEEATETERKSVKQLQKRLRGRSEVKKRLTLLFNPILQTHWIYKEYFEKWNDDENFYRDEDLLILRTTYKDNEFLTEDDIKALENETDKYYYDVYTLGKWGILGAVIYKNWEMADLTEFKKSADNLYCGNDFGFAKDPNGFIVTHYDKKKATIYILDEIYASELDNEQLANLIKKKITGAIVTCDSAEPKSIKELKKYGIMAIGAKKGPDSVDFGIKFLQKHKIIIDYKCVNFKNEISQYKWKEDKLGNVLPIPIDKFNHLLDGLRYAYEDEMRNKRLGWEN